MVHQFRGEAAMAHERVRAVIALSSEQGFPYWLAWGTFLRGWALAEQGHVKEGLAQMHQGLTTYRVMGTKIGEPYWLALLAEAYGKAGQFEEGLRVLDEALVTVEKSGERWWEAELYRLKGQLPLQAQTSPGQVKNKSKISHGQGET